MNNFFSNYRRQRITSYLFLFWLLGTVFCLQGCAPQAHIPAPGTEPDSNISKMEEKWGIRPESLRLSAADHMIDFRYRVTDPEKAVKITSDPKLSTYLLDQASGVKLAVPNTPKVGALRQTTKKPEADRIYFTLFGNVPNLVKTGSKVTVVMGDYRAEDLVVE
jgi:hypothetical protein